MAKKKSKHRRVDFSTYKSIHNRGFNPVYMEQLQDSLIARNYNEPQRLAFLSTALHESDGNPKAVAKGKDKNGKPVKFSGLYQWGDDRFPNSWNLGDKIHYALESAESKDTRKSWTDGGDGIPYIGKVSEGREAFWNSKGPYDATLYFNKGYVRPAEEQARINRAEEAANMAKNLFYNGGSAYTGDPYQYWYATPLNRPLISNNNGAKPISSPFAIDSSSIVNIPSNNGAKLTSSIAPINYDNYVYNSTYGLDSIFSPVSSPISQNVLNDINKGVKRDIVDVPALDENGMIIDMNVDSANKLSWTQQSSNAWNNAWKSKNIGSSIGSLAGGAMSIAQSTIDNAKIKDTTAEQAAIDSVANTTFKANNVNDLMSQYSTLEDIEEVSYRDLTDTTKQKALNTGKSALNGTLTGMQIGGPIGGIVGGVIGLGAGIGSWISGDKKAKEEADRLNREAEAAEQRRLANFDLANNNLKQQNLLYNMANYAKYGGPLFNEFSNGITKINEGGTHEENPHEGIQIGIDPEGIPNMVEEGEVIFNDYVFSDRLKVLKEVKDKLKLHGNKDMTFADAAKEIIKMSEEMPNDPIVKRTTENKLNELMMEQEMVRAKKNKNKKDSNTYDVGGLISALEYVEPIISIGEGIASRFTKPDYSTLKPYKQAIKAANVSVGTAPVKSNLKFVPVDKQRIINDMQASNAANVRNIMNTSGANPLVARAALLANNANYMNQLGKTWRSIEEAEYARQLAYDQYMTGLATNNAARDLQAQSARAEILGRQAGLWGNYSNSLMNIDNLTSAAVSSNWNNALASLSGLARQATNSNMLKHLADNGLIVGDDGTLKVKACGGKIKRNRRLS